MRFADRQRIFRSGFTVLEMTVVLCTIVILISLLLPAIQQAREQARRHQCQQNLAQIGIAFRTYQDAHRCLPSGVVNSTGPVVSRTHDANMFGGGGFSSMGGFGDYGMGSGGYGDGDVNEDPSDSGMNQEEMARAKEQKQFEELRSEYLISWLVQILPQLDRQTTYRRVDFQIPQLSFVSKVNRTKWLQQYEKWNTVDGAAVPWFPQPEPSSLAFLQCPSRVPAGSGGGLVATQYAGCYSSKPVPIDAGNDGLLYLNSSESLEDVPDGASTTILVGEAADGIFRSYYYGDHSSLRATVPIALKNQMDRFADYSRRGVDVVGSDFELTTDPVSMGFSASHNVLAQFLLADGSAVPISTMIDADVFAKLGSRNDGSLVSSDRF